MKLLMLMVLVSTPLLASLSIKTQCPQKFLGEVKQINESPNSPISLEKIIIVFNVLRNLRGPAERYRTQVEILKDSVSNLKIGQRFLIEMNQGLVCRIKLAN
jgi:hypothetical protein